jgi:S-adenosylmethionine synthetase
MTLEAAAGKNPVSHVGKLYNVLAERMANAVVGEIASVRGASIVLVSRIGHPVHEPRVVDIRLKLKEAVALDDVRAEVVRVASEQLGALRTLRVELVNGAVRLF